MDVSIKELEKQTLADLRVKAKKLGLKDFMELPKRELMIEVLKASTEKEGFVFNVCLQ